MESRPTATRKRPLNALPFNAPTPASSSVVTITNDEKDAVDGLVKLSEGESKEEHWMESMRWFVSEIVQNTHQRIAYLNKLDYTYWGENEKEMLLRKRGDVTVDQGVNALIK